MYNASTGKWETTDTTAVNNTLYTYKAISNCGGTTPSTIVDFANIVCPTVTLTSTQNTIAYSFTPIGGQVDKYEVEIWNVQRTTRLNFNTVSPVFTNPITGEFTGLNDYQTYAVRVVAYIGASSFACAYQNKQTLQTGALTLSNTIVTAGNTIDGITPLAWTGMTIGQFPVNPNTSAAGEHILYSGSLTIDATVTADIKGRDRREWIGLSV